MGALSLAGIDFVATLGDAALVSTGDTSRPAAPIFLDGTAIAGITPRPIGRMQSGDSHVEQIQGDLPQLLTIAWGYCLALCRSATQIIDTLADALGDPGIEDEISTAIGDAKTVGRIRSVFPSSPLSRARSFRKSHLKMWMATISISRRTGDQGIDRRLQCEAQGREHRQQDRGGPGGRTKSRAKSSRRAPILEYRIAEIGHWYEPDKTAWDISSPSILESFWCGTRCSDWGRTDPLAGFPR